MDCLGNHAFSHSANLFIFKSNFVLHLGGPNEQCGIREIFFWGQKVSYTGCRGMRSFWLLQDTVAGVSQYKLGPISNMSSNTDFNQDFKLYKFNF